MITRSNEIEVVNTHWGRLEWIVSRSRNNSTTMTFGRCIIKPGMANSRHIHPNCDEILHLVSGEIEHSMGDESFPMRAGDTISIPRGVAHNARSTGSEEAVMVISFSSADRKSLPADTFGTCAAELTVLSSMLSSDFETALDRHVELGMKYVDMKDGIFGKSITQLTLDEAIRAMQLLTDRSLEVYCLSSSLFGGDVSFGEPAFREANLVPLKHLLKTAEILRPRFIRLLVPQCADGARSERVAWVDEHAPWLWRLFREAISAILSAGFQCTIENETGNVIVDGPETALAFMERIDDGSGVKLTWDVQNMWQAGTFPTVEVYEKLKTVIGYVHLKGGRSETPGGRLVWRSSLADASWPVREIIERVITDGCSPLICLNPSHGASQNGEYIDFAEADIAWMQQSFRKVIT